MPNIVSAAISNPDLSAEEERKRMIQSGINYFEVAPPVCAANFGDLGPTPKEKIEIQRFVYAFFRGQGLSPVQAVGVMGNIQAESNFDPAVVEKANGIGFGIAQWSFGRRTTLENAATKEAQARGVPVKQVLNSLQWQLEYLVKEAKGRGSTSPDRANAWIPTPGKNQWEGLKQQVSVQAATFFWEQNFEVPRDSYQQQRVTWAKQMLANTEITGGETVAPGSADIVVGTSGCAGDTMGGTANCPPASAGSGAWCLPLDKKWFKQHISKDKLDSDWLTKRHHDGRAAIDLGVPNGTPVYSMTDGTVYRAPNRGGFGEGVTIEIPGNIIINYGHGLDGGKLPGIKVGQKVKAGQLIMHSSDTEAPGQYHVHIDIRTKYGSQPRVMYCIQPVLTAIYSSKPVPVITSLSKSSETVGRSPIPNCTADALKITTSPVAILPSRREL
ncbi:MAG: hypothetical protein JWL85_890 [Candidatus Saccharibacteria bacterium]|nr:hypothetical protein [Candidatus Saccharibacteria bacterium]